MNLDELRAVRDEERASGELQPLRPSFYAEAREFITEIKTERDEQFETAEDPLSDPAVVRLTDKHTSATEVLESIFEHRASKLLTHAMTVAAGEGAEPPEMTAEEAELYQQVVTAIQQSKATALEGAASSSNTDESPTPPTTAPPSDSPAEVSESSSAAEQPPEPAVDDEDIHRVTVRVTDDIGTILGVDEREYDLAAGDIVSLPVENAQALIEREVAEAVEAE